MRIRGEIKESGLWCLRLDSYIVICLIHPFYQFPLNCGKIVLSVAVLAIIITAPLGAIGLDAAYQRLLEKEN